MQIFRQSTNQNYYAVRGQWVTSLDGINGRSIQPLLRGENDSKQSDEFQAMFKDLRYTFFRILSEGLLKATSVITGPKRS